MGNFVDLEEDIPSADMVVLDRVICCNADMEGLVTASTRQTQRIYVLTYPRRTWWMRVGARAFNFGLPAMRREFRFFPHHPKEFEAAIQAAQFSLIQSAKHGPREMAAYRLHLPRIVRLVKASSAVPGVSAGQPEKCIQSCAISAGLTLQSPLYPVVTDRCTVAIASAK